MSTVENLWKRPTKGSGQKIKKMEQIASILARKDIEFETEQFNYTLTKRIYNPLYTLCKIESEPFADAITDVLFIMNCSC